MNQYQAYPFALNEAETHYKFQSIGKKGIVEKAISFSPIAPQIHNLALLDYCPVRRDYVDDTVTDNGDVPEIMATVMAVVLKYLEDHPENLVALSGNSKARTRLYQISIGSFY
ncbi:DUF6934 family protein [Dyadobacter sp. CY343]|uniref:DUF6934 family protein n=1 Tax=Dyadobacter sp. CY343 TaxID=2907299 RepID=UPI001F2C655D|nr:hypothetical protein [Dyadobacter sp. CY343]MCE7058693.1 hypothetical protein [Dyadobacter sp. CY343]